jgi:signal transduction histidine kinase
MDFKNFLNSGNHHQSLRLIYDQIFKGHKLQFSSSNLLLLNVEDFLGLAQIKAGKFFKNINKFNIKTTIEEIMEMQSYQAETKQIGLSTKFIGFPAKRGDIIQNNSNFLIESDENRIKQVLINLQSNAIKFTKSGGRVAIIC